MFEYSDYVYYIMYVVGFALMMVISIKTCGKYGIQKKSARNYTLLTYVYGVAGAMIMGKIYTAAAKHFGSDEGSRVAIFGAVIFTPLFLLITLKLQKKDARAYMDLLTPGIFVILTCAKFGCFLDGCCAGFPTQHGIYNPKLEMTVFPVQLCEVATMTALILGTQYFFKKSNRHIKGLCYPVTAALYCVCRFGWEFARYYSVAELGSVFLSLTFWQLWCILVFIVCSAIIITAVYKAKNTEHKTAKKPKH